MSEKTYKLDDLARDAGVSPRTVRYYVQRGLLAPPVFRGKDTMYDEHHLIRLRAIRRLQERFLPLDAIQVELQRSTDDALRALIDGPDAPPPVAPAPTEIASTYRRFVVTPGLEIHVADDADPMVRALAEELRMVAAGRIR